MGVLYSLETVCRPGICSGSVVKKPPAVQEPTGLIPGSGGGHGHPLRCPCLENPMVRGTWWATVHRAEKSPTQKIILNVLISSIVSKKQRKRNMFNRKELSLHMI